ncbi:MAG: hypothetical protein E6767_04775 [Dysgonomonas sp.]|nr:hypothetical protein [Dysgonomonas sp.]
MNIPDFLESLTSQDWFIDRTPVDPSKTTIDAQAKEKLNTAPAELRDFVCSFLECTNNDETIWFLSYQDYRDASYDIAHPWNTYEQQSIEYSDDDMHESIHAFWKDHIPFLMSVAGEYSYIAMGIGSENYGKIYQGFEPEYEEATLIAHNLFDFFHKFSKSLINF